MPTLFDSDLSKKQKSVPFNLRGNFSPAGFGFRAKDDSRHKIGLPDDVLVASLFIILFSPSPVG